VAGALQATPLKGLVVLGANHRLEIAVKDGVEVPLVIKHPQVDGGIPVKKPLLETDLREDGKRSSNQPFSTIL